MQNMAVELALVESGEMTVIPGWTPVRVDGSAHELLAEDSEPGDRVRLPGDERIFEVKRVFFADCHST